MRLIGRLPRLRAGRPKGAGRDEVFFIAMLAALQKGEKGRAIEAAIALLDTANVHGVIAAARSLAARLSDCRLTLRPIGAAAFDHFAGYPVVHPVRAAAPGPDAARSGRPLLRLLESA
jgi:hypothetical protein